MNDKLKVGDYVEVLDPGLIMLQNFMPPGTPPNNRGWVKKFMDDGYILIEFPIGDDPIDEHSQIAPYERHEIRKIGEE